MLPYTRSAKESERPNNQENFTTLKMLETPYKANALSSETDNSSRSINNNHLNVNYRYVQYAAYNDPNYIALFSDSSVDYMLEEVTKRLKGVHPEGKNIIVPRETLLGVADSFYQNTKYTLAMLQEMVILHIVEQIKNDYEITQQNDKLNPWVQLYSVDTSLRQFNDYKLNERRRVWSHSWNY